MFGRGHVMGAALAVTLFTALIWLLAGPGPVPAQETQPAPIAPQSPLQVDLDGDGRTENVWLTLDRPGNQGSVYPVVRRMGMDIAAHEGINWPASGLVRLHIYELSPRRKAIGIWMPWGKAGEGLGLYALEAGEVRFLGAFFADEGVDVADLDGDKTAEVVLHHLESTQPPEVYVLNNGAYVYSPAASARLQQESGRPTRP